jgi:Heterokaryon incompatibility protein (HET)
VVSPDDNEITSIKRVRYLGKLEKIREKTFCPFCRLVLDIADRPPDQRSPSLHLETDHIVCYARWVIDGQDDLGQDPNHTGEHLFQPRTRRLLIYSEPQAFKDGYLVLLGEDAPFPQFFGRKVSSPDLLDADLLKSWLRDCEAKHGAECEESLVHPDLYGDKRTHVFRAVDVDQMCIVAPPEDSRYVALSYLWGRKFNQLFTTSENLAELSIPGALGKKKLPRTIKDAITLTQMIGERYLWTDSLALLHDDGFQYHDDWIYARAALTVVAGSGKDANAGLPGVRKESRTFHQEIEQVKPELRLMVSHLAEGKHSLRMTGIKPAK